MLGVLPTYYVERRERPAFVRLLVFDQRHHQVDVVDAPSEDEAYTELLRRTAAMLNAVRAYGKRRKAPLPPHPQA